MPLSLSQSELADARDVNVFKASRSFGHKLGGGRFEFTATSGKAIAAHGLSLIVPAGSVVTRVVYKVLTTFTSATDAGTIALSIVGANDVVSAVAISNGGNPWDAAALPVATIVTPTLATWLVAASDLEVTATVAVEALTAGKLVGYVEWLYYGDLALT